MYTHIYFVFVLIINRILNNWKSCFLLEQKISFITDIHYISNGSVYVYIYYIFVVFNFGNKYNHWEKKWRVIFSYKDTKQLFSYFVKQKNGKTKKSRKLFFILIVFNLINVRVIAQHIHVQQKNKQDFIFQFHKKIVLIISKRGCLTKNKEKIKF